MTKNISIIIVNFNTSELLKKCLQSIYVSSGPICYETIVIDNNSKDDSCEMVQSQFPDVILIQNTTNTGFSYANNQGLQNAGGDYIFLLNPDTELFPDTLLTLKNFMDAVPDAGAAGPRTFLDHARTLEVCTLKLLTPARVIAAFTQIPFPMRQQILEEIWKQDISLWYCREPIPVEGIGGAGFFVRRSLITQLGGLDERFFMGYEDTDLAAGLRRIGKKIYIVPDAHLIHLFGQSKKLPDAPDQTIYSWKQGPALFIQKHYGAPMAWLLRSLKLVDAFIRRANRRIILDPVSVSADRDHNISWPDQNVSEYLFELSNDLTFFDKFAARVQQPQLFLPQPLLIRLSRGIWYWRVITNASSTHPVPFIQGTVVLT